MEAFVIFTDSDGQILSENIKKDNKNFAIPIDSEVNLYLRHASSDVLKVNGAPANIDDYEEGAVSYEWDDADIDEPGEYFGWWRIENSDNSNMDTAEFFVIVTKHSPGLRAEIGAVYMRAKGIIPSTWVALEQLETYGDKSLQDTIEIVKLTVLNTNVLPADEIDLDIRVQEYLSMLAVLRTIPAGIDYWSSQYSSVTSQGSPAIEIATYPDRLAALKEIQERLIIEVAKLRPIIEDILDIPQTTPSYGVPGVSDGGDCLEGFVTPNPTYHFRDYAFPGRRSDRYRGGGASIWP